MTVLSGTVRRGGDGALRVPSRFFFGPPSKIFGLSMLP